MSGKSGIGHLDDGQFNGGFGYYAGAYAFGAVTGGFGAIGATAGLTGAAAFGWDVLGATTGSVAQQYISTGTVNPYEAIGVGLAGGIISYGTNVVLSSISREVTPLLDDIYQPIIGDAYIPGVKQEIGYLYGGLDRNAGQSSIPKIFGSGVTDAIEETGDAVTNRSGALVQHPFAEGATHITTTSRLSRFPDSTTFGGPQGLYVSPTKQINELLANGATREEMEIMLGLEKGALSQGELVRIDIANPFECNLRLPDPATGNIYHRPGTGLTWGGLNEGLIDSPFKSSTGVSSQIIGR